MESDIQIVDTKSTCFLNTDAKLPAQATPSKRKRGKCMSRRAQVGSIEISGRWYVVRFWKDVPGQDARIHACERICPVSGPGNLSKTNRKRRALEIVFASGVNSPHHFAQNTAGTTFQEQARQFMSRAITRKRKPIKPATISSWQNCLDKWLIPALGNMLLSNVSNGAVKVLVANMQAAGLSPKSISNYVGLVKLVVASALDDDGEPLFPRKWNHDFMDMPIVANQRQPSVSSDVMSSIVSIADERERMLYALLAASGLRIGEALGLEVNEHLSDDCRTILVRQSLWEGARQSPKTPSAIRDVDLCSDIATLLKAFVGDRTEGFLFRNRTGTPLLQTNVLRSSLHPILRGLGVEITGFHAFRRFRATWLRKTGVPRDLEDFWMGHAPRTVGDLYSKLSEDVQFRREVVNRIGLGFTISREEEAVRNVRISEHGSVNKEVA